MKTFGVSIKGGAARGFGSIGLIRFLQEENLHPTVIAGSSSGAIVAAMYAQGYSWEKMLEVVKSIKLLNVFSVRSLLGDGCLVSEERFAKVFQTYSEDINIEDLPVKLIIFASDTKTGKRVYLRKGNLMSALIASCAYPFVLSPVTLGKSKLIDGDLTNAFSAERLRMEGAEKIIGVGYKMNGFHPNFGKGLDKVLDMYRFMLSQVESLHDDMYRVDLELRYNAGDYSYFNFSNLDKLVDRAYKASKKSAKDINSLILS